MSSSWERVQTASGDALVKDFDCGDFKGSVAFLNAVLAA
jgi:pterin-4a-carbinolamine dehydratase